MTGYDVVYALGLLVGSPWFIWKMITQGKYRAGLWERLGNVSVRTGDRKCVWVHGVSVGEVLAGRTLVREFRLRHPDWDVVVSSTTNTGVNVARDTYPDLTVIYYPFDFSWAVKRALSRIRPDLILLIEADLWPDFLAAARRRHIPVVMVNNCIKEKSMRLQRRLGALGRRIYDGIVAITAQTEDYASRLRRLGIPDKKISVVGSLKYDTSWLESPHPGTLRDEIGIRPDDVVLVAGSTFAGEEKIILDTYRRLKDRYPRLRLVLVPRHKTRFEEVARLIRRGGFALVRRSGPGSEVSNGDAVILGDTMGELTRFYALADLVFVGKSLVKGGGQNILEPAVLGKPVLFGPSVFNFRESAEALVSAGAARQVADANGLEQALSELIDHPDHATVMGQLGRQVVQARRGATARNADIIDKVLAGTAVK